jgi:hypothetical protein
MAKLAKDTWFLIIAVAQGAIDAVVAVLSRTKG